VRLTLSMGDQPNNATVQGQQVLQAQLALPTGGLFGYAMPPTRRLRPSCWLPAHQPAFA
jgi:hypothetical protein